MAASEARNERQQRMIKDMWMNLNSLMGHDEMVDEADGDDIAVDTNLPWPASSTSDRKSVV